MGTAWLIELPMVKDHLSATSRVATRRVVVLMVEDDEHSGWGEAAPIPGYTEDTVEDAWASLQRGHRLSATASAAFEAAKADLDARRRGIPLWRAVGARHPRVLAGAIVPLGTAGEVVAEVARLVEAGYRHLKLKIAPGHDRAVLAAIRSGFPALSLGVDGNGSYPDDADLTPLAEFDLAYVEQPFATAAAHTRLRGALGAPICLDESVRSVDDARRIIGTGVADALSVKPSIVGTSAAVAIHDMAFEAGIRLRIGGLLETSVGRAHAAAIGSLPGFDLPGDLSPPDRYLAADVAPTSLRVDGDGYLALSVGPGLGLTPDPNALDENSLESALKFVWDDSR